MQVEKSGLLVLAPAENISAISGAKADEFTSHQSALTYVYDVLASLAQDPSKNGISVDSSDLLLKKLNEAVIDLVVLPVGDDTQSLLASILSTLSPPAVLVIGEAHQSDLLARCLQLGASCHYVIDPGESRSEDKTNHELLLALVDQSIRYQVQRRNNQRQVCELEAELDHVSEDQRAAFDVQQRLLPQPQSFGDISFSYRILPRHGMSGDGVNCIELGDGRLLFYLSDVAGHGVLGGVIATALTITAKSLTNKHFDPTGLSSSDLLDWFNRAMLALDLERHVTMFLGVISKDRASLQYSSAAHFPGTILCQDKVCSYLELGGLPLGVCETQYESRSVNLSRTFELVLFSDGVLEILPQDSIEKREHHLISLVESGTRDVSGLSVDLSLEGRAKIPDDIAVLTLQRTR